MKLKKYKKKFKSNMNSQQLKKYAHRVRVLTGIYEKRQFVNLICIKCKRECHIRVNDKNNWSDNIKKNYICLICKSGHDNWRKRLERKELL